MPLDASIPLATQPVQIQSPLTSISQLMQTREAIQNLALNAAKIDQQKAEAAEQQAQADQRNRDLADQNTVMQAFKDPDTSKRLHTGDFSDLESKVQPKTLDALRTNQSNYQKSLNALTTEQQGIRSKALGSVVDTISGLKSLIGEDGDTSRVNVQLPGIVASLKANNVLKDAGFPDMELPNQIQDPKQLDDFLAAVGGQQAAIEKQLGQKETQAKTAASQAAAGKDAADALKARADAAKTQAILDSVKSGAASQSGAHPVDAVLPPGTDPQANAAFKAEYDATPLSFGDNPSAGKNAVLERAGTHAAELSSTNRAKKVADAVAIENAKAPLETARAVNVANINRQGQEHVTAQGEYQKSIQTLNDSVADATRLHNLISSAQGGNKAAPGVIPLAELRGFVNRVNSTELRAVSTQAGSLADQIDGWIKGKTEGQPIPPEILRATDDLAKLQVSQAEQKHAGSVNAINMARGEKFSAATAADLGYKASAPTSRYKVGQTVRLKSGASATITKLNAEGTFEYK